MKFKKIAAMGLSAFCLFTTVGTAYADAASYPGYIISPAYEYADIAASRLSISGQTAYCTSKAEGDVISITVEQTLQKQGFLWLWYGVEDASWKEAVSESTIIVVNTRDGLSDGKYRLKSVFTLTNSTGKTETITVYSDEKSV